MLSLSLDTMLALYLQKLAALDRYDCGKRYLCELAASEQPDLAGQLALDLFQVEGLHYIKLLVVVCLKFEIALVIE